MKYTSQILDFVSYTNGRGISGVVNWYYASTSDNITDIPVNATWYESPSDTSFDETNKFLWNYEEIKYDDNTSSTTDPAVIAVYSKDGAPGRGISEIQEWYQLTSNNSAPTILPGTTGHNWKNTIQIPTEDDPYLWNYEIVVYTNGDKTPTGPACIGVHGKKGNDGKGIKTTTISYAKTTSKVDPSTIAAKDWQSDIPTAGENEYLWTRTIIDYTDDSDTVSYTYTHQGQTIKGDPGTSVTVKSIEYQQGDSATTAPTGTWSTSIPSTTQGKYLWSKTTFSDGKVAYGISYQSVDGTSPYLIELTNDSGTVGANADGSVDTDALRAATETTVMVYNGDTQLTSDLSYIWSLSSTSNTALNSTSAKTVYFTKLGVDTATATVEVKYKSNSIGKKSFTISKNKQGNQGEPAETYVLQVTPQIVNLSDTELPSISGKVLKYVGSEVTDITSNALDNNKITAFYDDTPEIVVSEALLPMTWDPQHKKLTVRYYIVGDKDSDKKIYEEEVITTVSNGDTPTVELPDQEYEIAFYTRNDSWQYETKPNKDTIGDSTIPTIEKPWVQNPDLMGESGAPYVYKSVGTKTITYNDNNTASITYNNWSTPELVRMYNDGGADQTQYATFFKMTNGNTDGIYQEDDKLALKASYLQVERDGKNLITAIDNDKLKLLDWTATNNALSYGTIGENNSMYLSPTGWSSTTSIGGSGTSSKSWVIAAGPNFGVTKAGKLYANDAQITGHIEAGTGSIGGWDISNGELVTTDAYISPINGLKVGNNFSVTSTGLLSANGAILNFADIKGTITSENGFIGGWEISPTGLLASKFKLYSKPVFTKPSLLSSGNSGISFVVGVGYTYSTIDTMVLSPEKKQYFADNLIMEFIFECEEPDEEKSFRIITNNNKTRVNVWGYNGEGFYCELIASEDVYINNDITLSLQTLEESLADAPICILADGSLYAQGASITGTVNATSGTFAKGCSLGPTLKIGEWQETGVSILYSGTINKVPALWNGPGEDYKGFMIGSSNDGADLSVLAIRNSTDTIAIYANGIIFNRGTTSYQNGVMIETDGTQSGTTNLKIAGTWANSPYISLKHSDITIGGKVTFKNEVIFDGGTSIGGEYKPTSIVTDVINPTSNGAGSLGTDTLKWGGCYINTGNFTTIKTKDLEVTGTFTCENFTPKNTAFDDLTTKNILPRSGGMYSLGKEGQGWAEVCSVWGQFLNLKIGQSANGANLPLIVYDGKGTSASAVITMSHDGTIKCETLTATNFSSIIPIENKKQALGSDEKWWYNGYISRMHANWMNIDGVPVSSTKKEYFAIKMVGSSAQVVSNTTLWLSGPTMYIGRTSKGDAQNLYFGNTTQYLNQLGIYCSTFHGESSGSIVFRCKNTLAMGSDNGSGFGDAEAVTLGGATTKTVIIGGASTTTLQIAGKSMAQYIESGINNNTVITNLSQRVLDLENNVQKYYDQGYNVGYTLGYDTGYAEGYSAGSSGGGSGDDPGESEQYTYATFTNQYDDDYITFRNSIVGDRIIYGGDRNVQIPIKDNTSGVYITYDVKWCFVGGYIRDASTNERIAFGSEEEKECTFTGSRYYLSD